MRQMISCFSTVTSQVGGECAGLLATIINYPQFAELLIEGLGRASPLEEPEACVYGYGAVRFLANSHLLTSGNELTKKETRNKCLAFRLAHHGSVQLMVVHLQILNEAGSSTALHGAPLHALFQLSSALRALAGNVMVVEAVNNQANSVSFTTSPTSEECPEIKESLEGYDIQMELAGPHLVKAAEICMTDTETQFNIIRTLSALSDIDKCCGGLSEYAARLAVLLGPCLSGDKKDNDVSEKPLGLLSRLGYILGNIVGKHDSARLNVSQWIISLGVNQFVTISILFPSSRSSTTTWRWSIW